MEGLSTTTHFKNTSQLSVGSGLDFSSSEMSLDGIEASRHGCPVVLIGWALFASPYSQLAMAKNVNDRGLIEDAYRAIERRAGTNAGKMARRIMEERSDRWEDGEHVDGQGENSKPAVDDAWNGGYFLPDEFGIQPRATCRFLRKVEAEYSPCDANPYHNNVHAADVLQSTHALIQMGGEGMACAYSPLEIYSILLAAALHDVRHPGTNNNYQVNRMTEWSMIYNDNSVLENMHASRASYLLVGSEDGGDGELNGGGDAVLGTMTREQRRTIRTGVTRSILYTDMSRHFSEVAKIARHVDALEDEIAEEAGGEVGGGSSGGSSGDDDGGTPSPPPAPALLPRVGGRKHAKLRGKLLPFLLHLADIGNPTKPRDVSVEWAHRVYDEFFLQGDREAAEGVPASPLCDRATTNRPEAQVGFMSYVVGPAFVLLARCIPRVNDVVMTQFEENFRYWEEEKEKINNLLSKE